MKNWLVQRLTPAKRALARWSDLATAIQTVWEEFFDPDFSRLERLRSFYQADYQDLATKLREMGDYFSNDLPNAEDRILSVAWRRAELDNKDYETILFSMFRRHFGTLPVGWLPIFAPMDEPYGTTFIPYAGEVTDEEKNIPTDGCFLTSRGMLGVDYGKLLTTDFSKEDFLTRAVPLLTRTKPLHIVYAGPLFYIVFPLPFESEFAATFESFSPYTLLFSTVGARYDFIPADVMPVDNSLRYTSSFIGEFSLQAFDPRFYRNGLDRYIPEGFSEGMFPTDMLIARMKKNGPFRVYHTLTEAQIPLEASASSINLTTTVQEVHTDTVFPHLNTTHLAEENDIHLLPFAKQRITLDHLPCFDHIPGDFMPLDVHFTEGEGVYA